MRLATAYNIALGVASATNARVTPLGIQTIRVACTNDCYITIGTAPVATLTASTLVRASLAGEVFNIAAGEQIAVIAATAAGTINVTEMTY